jgi:hypothetical protein
MCLELYYVFDDWKHSETSQMSRQKIQNYRFNIEEKFYITCSHGDITEKNINWSYTTITH